MRSRYVGMGNIAARFRDHWDRKDFSEELFVYFTYVEMSNRLSKYFEQVLLDLYHFPLNKSENTGCKVLYQHFAQSDVD